MGDRPRSISEPIRTDQPAVSAISHEIALPDGKNPSYFPYVRLEYGRAPRAPAIIEHEQAMGRFDGEMKQYRPAQPTSTPRYSLYRDRFISHDRFRARFPDSVGISPSLTIWHWPPQLAIVENPGYRRITISNWKPGSRDMRWKEHRRLIITNFRRPFVPIFYVRFNNAA